VERSRLDDPEVDALIAAMMTELGERYPEEADADHPNKPRAEQFVPPTGVFVLARLDDRPVGCGGVRPLERGIGEIKRMFVDPRVRRSGVGRAVLAALEDEAARLGYTALKLETGTRQPEAIELYESAGYRSIPCFDNEEWELSRCYEKGLGAA
jgi:GNAT superfamily N-acetyltransferase